NDLTTLLPMPRPLAEPVLYVYVFAAALAVWWVALGTVLWAVPRVAVAVFRPFADGFGRRQAVALVLTGLALAALCLSLFVRVMGTDGVLVNEYHLDQWNHVASVDGPRR